jgi:DNA helicase-2/ATP-dependent DNA helicase PcrA
MSLEDLDPTPDDPEADPLLADLTGPQREAVEHTEGPLLIVAAAGSGKTRTITRRIAYLVRAGIPPWSILALTFTNKAAAEMRDRVVALLGGDPESPTGPQDTSRPLPRTMRGLTVTTFHSLGARLLRRYADAAVVGGVALKPDFTIYDAADQAALVKKVIEGLGLSTSNWPPRSVLAAISKAKNDLMDSAAFAARAGDFYGKMVAKVYGGYEAALRAASAVDFDDLLLLTARVLRDRPDVLEDCRRRWQYLLIDEYQDTNRAQFVIAALLAGGEAAGKREKSGEMGGAGEGGGAGGKPNICIVGDPDQSIYAWRGADISNILDFEKQYPGARVITLGENFRSTAPILAVADALIRHNVRRRHKDLFTRRPGGEKVRLTLTRDERHEASLVVNWFRSLHEGEEEGSARPAGLAWREMAVLYRTNALSRVMEDGLRAAGIPYVIARGTAFYEREEVRNAMAYLRVVANPADEVSLLRIINTPTRGIGDAGLARVQAFAAGAGLPLMDALRRAGEAPGVPARARGAMLKFAEMVDGWTGGGTFLGAGVAGSLSELVERVIVESGLRKMYATQAAASGSEPDSERLDNLDEVVSSAHQFELEYDPSADPFMDVPRGPGGPGGARGAQGGGGDRPDLLAMLRGYLESVSLVADADAVDPAQGAVMLLTLHAAKGLEFPAVAMIGLEEGMLPHSRARESEADLEEERRLCFVGITRAMRELHISCAKYRTLRGLSERTIPSRFLAEMGTEHTLISDQSDALEGLGDGWDQEPAAPDPSARGSLAPSGGPGPGGRAGGKFPVGSLVRHPQFGVGKVLSITGGGSARAQIQFRDVGTKTLVLEYARLERVGGA